MAAKDEEKPRFSLLAYIEQTAKMLRNAVRPASKKTRSYTKDSPSSSSNKIEQIARMLRREAKKSKKKK